MFTGSSFDSWLTTDKDAESYAAAEESIAERAKELQTEANYDCTLFENFSLDLYSATAEQAESIEEYLKSRDFEKLGRLVWSISYETRQKMAETKAFDEWDASCD